MTLILELSPYLEKQLVEAAERENLSVDDYARKLLEAQFAVKVRAEKLSTLFQAWLTEEGQEQSETGDYLINALDRDRPSNRKLYPGELKGKSW